MVTTSKGRLSPERLERMLFDAAAREVCRIASGLECPEHKHFARAERLEIPAHDLDFNIHACCEPHRQYVRDFLLGWVKESGASTRDLERDF